MRNLYLRLSQIGTFTNEFRLPFTRPWHPTAAFNPHALGVPMSRLLPITLLSTLIAATFAYAQVAPAQSVVSPTAATAPSDSADVPETNPDISLDPASLLPDLPSLPSAKATLIGGTVAKLDRVQDRLTLQVFGGGKMKIVFDPRTRIYRDGVAASAGDLRQGDRVYVDTILDGSTVFARSIRLKGSAATGETQGVVVSYARDRGELIVRDLLSPESVKVHLNASTKIVNGDKASTSAELAPGTLVAVKFGAQRDGHDLASEVSVLAVPGASFAFVGQVTVLDLRAGLLILKSSTDQKTYEIHLDPGVVTVDDTLRQGSDVSILARYDGDRYVARTLKVSSRP
jgi:hypothetical protein